MPDHRSWLHRNSFQHWPMRVNADASVPHSSPKTRFPFPAWRSRPRFHKAHNATAGLTLQWPPGLVAGKTPWAHRYCWACWGENGDWSGSSGSSTLLHAGPTRPPSVPALPSATEHWDGQPLPWMPKTPKTKNCGNETASMPKTADKDAPSRHQRPSAEAGAAHIVPDWRAADKSKRCSTVRNATPFSSRPKAGTEQNKNNWHKTPSRMKSGNTNAGNKTTNQQNLHAAHRAAERQICMSRCKHG